MDSQLGRIAECLATVLDQPDLPARIAPSTNLLEDVRLDSLQMISFLLSVEDEFDVAIDFERLETEHLQSLSAFREFALGPVGR